MNVFKIIDVVLSRKGEAATVNGRFFSLLLSSEDVEWDNDNEHCYKSPAGLRETQPIVS